MPKMRLNKYQRAWIARLKSGETKKADAQLNSRGGAMCCLGVAIKVCGLEDMKTLSFRKTHYLDEDLGSFAKTKEILRLEGDTGNINLSKVSSKWMKKIGGNIGTLADMNDSGDPKFSHVTIGEFIDENREAVFNPPEPKAKKR